MNTRTKTLALQRAYFNEGYNGSLENLLKAAFSKLDRNKDRVVDVDLFKSRLFASCDDCLTGEGVFLRVFEYEKGAIGVIDSDTNDQAAVVEAFDHPENREFLKDEIVIYVVNNHIIACNLGNKSGTFASNVLNFCTKAGVLNPDINMLIADVPDKTTLDRLDKVGVKSVDFGITTYMERLDISTSSTVGARIMGMILAEPEESSAIRKRANAVGKLSLRRGRFTKNEAHKDEWLTGIGKELMVAGSSESFTIDLEDGTRLSNSSLKRSKSVKLRRHANSYSFENAKMELSNFYKQLKNDGSLGV